MFDGNAGGNSSAPFIPQEKCSLLSAAIFMFMVFFSPLLCLSSGQSAAATLHKAISVKDETFRDLGMSGSFLICDLNGESFPLECSLNGQLAEENLDNRRSFTLS